MRGKPAIENQIARYSKRVLENIVTGAKSSQNMSESTLISILLEVQNYTLCRWWKEITVEQHIDTYSLISVAIYRDMLW